MDRSGKALRVLIVEDEALVALDYALTIEDAGAYVVGTASTADAAEKLAKALRPDVIVMDVSLMGTKDGIEAAHAIRASSAAPIVFLTGPSAAGAHARIRAFNGSAPVTKPADNRTLISAIARAAGLMLLLCLGVL